MRKDERLELYNSFLNESRQEPKLSELLADIIPEETTEIQPEVEQASAPEIEATTAPEIEATTAPEIEATTAPEIEATTAPEIEATTAPLELSDEVKLQALEGLKTANEIYKKILGM